jgi:nitric oxide synthase-interacting protein
MAHSKRNTSLPHFTSYERNLLRSTWGTKRSVIGRDSFLPFASCRLCLQPARAPVVACASNGDLFCRECAINDLLAQRQEIKRLEKDREEAKKRIAEDEERMLEAARKKDLRDFELVSMGLDAARSGGGRKRKAGEGEEEERALAAFKAREVEVDGVRKKVFELDEREMARVAREERKRLMGEIKKEKVWTCISLRLGIVLEIPVQVADMWWVLCRTRVNRLYHLSGSRLLRRQRITMKSRRTKLLN